MLTNLVDYNYYSTKYGGSSIPESSFQKKQIEASRKINYYTSNRISNNNLDDNIRNTTCEVAELLFEQEELKNKVKQNSIEAKEIASETLGPRSISYVNKSNLQANQILSGEELENKIYRTIYQALVHTGLMNRCIYEQTTYNNDL